MGDTTYLDIFREFSHMASHNPEKLKRRSVHFRHSFRSPASYLKSANVTFRERLEGFSRTIQLKTVWIDLAWHESVKMVDFKMLQFVTV
ncbi:hypothetical protein Z043_106151 [Scleropages formosus]|uniref:Uncharacterized protein n=1 Tax=Scleropages formosus TaxID=113540 RepID=A0A0P7V120_SCLFO|nr:hypothetical protein Z043_106151 [Scleropages formosus]